MRKRFMMVTGAALATAAAVAIAATNAGAAGADHAATPAAAATSLSVPAGAAHFQQREIHVKVPAAAVGKAGRSAAKAAPNAAALLDVTCLLRLDYPHNSAHVDGTVNVVAQTSCDAPMTSITLLLQLYYEGSVANSVINENTGVASLTQSVAAPCINGGWQAHAETLVVFPPGVVPPSAYDSEDSQPISIDCGF